MEKMSEVLETAGSVAERSLHVRIDRRALLRFSRELSANGVSIPPWDSTCHFFDGSEETVSYLLVVDALNFCFWPAPGKERWRITYKLEELSGYYALAASIKRAVDSGVPITRAEYLAELSPTELKQILGGRGDLQLLGDRAKILNELGQVLLRNYHGNAWELVEHSQMSAVRLARLLASEFTSFRDIAQYRGETVFLLKRAQIFAADLHGAFAGRSWGSFSDIGGLTCFADYKLPQVLHGLGILLYSPSLTLKVDGKEHLGAGGPEEVEIRTNSIWAIELIRRELNRMGERLHASEIDWILWNLGQKEDFRKRPYHRTVTIFY